MQLQTLTAADAIKRMQVRLSGLPSRGGQIKLFKLKPLEFMAAFYDTIKEAHNITPSAIKSLAHKPTGIKSFYYMQCFIESNNCHKFL